jgi:hypothetical protein
LTEPNGHDLATANRKRIEPALGEIKGTAADGGNRMGKRAAPKRGVCAITQGKTIERKPWIGRPRNQLGRLAADNLES